MPDFSLGMAPERKPSFAYLQAIDVGEDVGVPEGLQVLEGCLGDLRLLLRVGLYVVHEQGHLLTCGLKEGAVRGSRQVEAGLTADQGG